MPSRPIATIAALATVLIRYTRNRRTQPAEAAKARFDARWAIAALALSLALFAFAALRSTAFPSVGMGLTQAIAATFALLACVWLAAGVALLRR